MCTRKWLCVALGLFAVVMGLVLSGGHPTSATGAPPRNISTGEKGKTLAPGDIDLDRSRVYVFVGKARLGHEHAIEGRLRSGSLRLKPQQAGSLEFDMTSFDADTPAARAYLGMKGETPEATRQKVNDNMHSAAVLDVDNHPTALFNVQSAEMVKTAKGVQQRLKGQFSLHGVTRDITILADATSEKGFVHLRGQFEILQSDFGIKPFKAALGAVGVADRLVIYGDLWVRGEDSR